MKRVCVYCKSNFECQTGKKRYCSIECQKKQRSIYNKIKYSSNKEKYNTYVKTNKRFGFKCVICNKKTTSKVKHTLSCKSCRNTYYNSIKKANHNERYNNDINYRLASNLRSRFKGALKKYLEIKYTGRDIFSLCSCSIEELIKHLENQFTNNMSWVNYGKWHIDHIKPICEFDLRDEKQIKKCFHYSNLQPLWAEDNYKKSKKSLVKPLKNI